MIGRIIAFSARHRGLVILVAGLLAAYAYTLLGRIRLDALPDLSDTQVIVLSRWERSPDIVEDQVTYPIITALLGSPRVKAIRGLTDYGYSFVYVIFEDGTDLYWARSRVAEALGRIQAKLPSGVSTELGPDATGVGWVYQYALVDRDRTQSLEGLRSYQDWTLRYALQAVPGVAEVASVGGYTRQYQITVDPERMRALGVGFAEVVAAVKRSNDETGGRLIDISGTEFMVRGRGYARRLDEFASIVIKGGSQGVPIRVRDLASVALGPEGRRGVADLDGSGDTVGGIVVMRSGENALNVIAAVKARLAELAPSLPAGVEVLPVYDRSDLIERALGTLRHELILQMIVVSLVILLFLWHFPSAFVPILTIPLSVLLAFIPLYHFGVTVNLMSLAGIAISIGVLVDGAIIEVENAYNKLQHWEAAGRPGDPHQVRLAALQEVGPAVFFSLLVIAVAFLPVFALVDQEGRLFHPLASSKNLTMLLAALLAVTLDPAIRLSFSRLEPYQFRPRWLAGLVSRFVVGRYHAEERHPVNRILVRIYEPICRFTLRRPWLPIGAALLVLALTLPLYRQLGQEFMPPLHEGTILYMPTTLPGLAIGQAAKLLETQDRLLRQFPEVERVFGKAGRAETATDPAPLSMFETVITLRPESSWRAKPAWYDDWPEVIKPAFRPFWPDRIEFDELVDQLDRALRLPGVTNAWTMPIKTRIDMLSTGIRTPVGVKVLGDDLVTIDQVSAQIEAALRHVPGARSVFAERVTGGYFLDLVPRRDQLARYGLTVDDMQAIVTGAIGGESVTTTIEGRARYSVNVRYPRELRQDPAALAEVLVPTPSGAHIPLGQIATISLERGAAMIRNDNGFLAGYVYIDVAGRDIGGFVTAAKQAVASQVAVPPGVVLSWSGQYENMQRVRERLALILPITIVLIIGLIYANTRSLFKTALVLLAVPFSLVGAIWLFHLLDYNVSIAAWVGTIALLGLDAETGIFMLLFLDLSYDAARAGGRQLTRHELDEAIVHGAAKRVRPKIMTVAAALIGLLPILWSTSAGADVMKRIAAPMIGGLATSLLMELLVYPPIYKLWKRRELRGLQRLAS